MIWHKESTRPGLKRLYTRLLPRLRAAARRCGFALGVHGSMKRDFDLVAVPWVDKAVEPFVLIDRLSMAACGLHAPKIVLSRKPPLCAQTHWTKKPHGRRAITIMIGRYAHLDVSIIPFLKSKEPA